MSVNKIRTTHVGSLPRTPELLEANIKRANGELGDEQFSEILRAAVDEVVKRQVDMGIDIVNEGSALAVRLGHREAGVAHLVMAAMDMDGAKAWLRARNLAYYDVRHEMLEHLDGMEAGDPGVAFALSDLSLKALQAAIAGDPDAGAAQFIAAVWNLPDDGSRDWQAVHRLKSMRRRGGVAAGQPSALGKWCVEMVGEAARGSYDPVVGREDVIERAEQILSRRKKNNPILLGEAGVGKTSIVEAIATRIADGETMASLRGCRIHSLDVVGLVSGTRDRGDLEARIKSLMDSLASDSEAILFVDEIHRFNRAQQDGFLPVVEEGVVTLVGATTENPSFELNAALLSRCQVLVLKRLDEAALSQMLARAEALEGKALALNEEARTTLIAMADGDGRYLLNLAEEVFALEPKAPLTPAELAGVLHKRAPVYDKDRDEHYNLISALHKSVRGSDPDAALYWLARMLAAGEDPLFLARRLVRMANEDIGLADPTAIHAALAAKDTYDFLGSPEGELALAQAVVHLACAPKSNAVYTAFKGAQRLARETGSLMPPAHILNAPTRLMEAQGYGKGYEYDHDAPGGVSGQDYFPDEMADRPRLYQPKGEGREGPILERLERWRALRGKRRG